MVPGWGRRDGGPPPCPGGPAFGRPYLSLPGGAFGRRVDHLLSPPALCRGSLLPGGDPASLRDSGSGTGGHPSLGTRRHPDRRPDSRKRGEGAPRGTREPERGRGPPDAEGEGGGLRNTVGSAFSRPTPPPNPRADRGGRHLGPRGGGAGGLEGCVCC